MNKHIYTFIAFTIHSLAFADTTVVRSRAVVDSAAHAAGQAPLKEPLSLKADILIDQITQEKNKDETILTKGIGNILKKLQARLSEIQALLKQDAPLSEKQDFLDRLARQVKSHIDSFHFKTEDTAKGKAEVDKILADVRSKIR